MFGLIKIDLLLRCLKTTGGECLSIRNVLLLLLNRYTAPFELYAAAWSKRQDPLLKFRLAVGSFIEEYNNKASFSWYVFSNKKVFSGLNYSTSRGARWIRSYRHIWPSLSGDKTFVDTRRQIGVSGPASHHWRLFASVASGWPARCQPWSITEQCSFFVMVKVNLPASWLFKYLDF